MVDNGDIKDEQLMGFGELLRDLNESLSSLTQATIQKMDES